MKTTFSCILLIATLLANVAQSQTISAKSDPVKVRISSIPKVSPPVLTWIYPYQSNLALAEASVLIKVGVNSHPKIRINKATLYKNGQEVSNGQGHPSVEAANYEKFIEKEVELSNGPNEIKVVAENERGEITTESKIINVKLPVSDVLTYADLGINYLPTYYALVIGVSEYINTEPGLENLSKPVKDAEKLYNVLTSKYAFSPENTKLLKNPTREDIVNEFEVLARKVTNQDNVMIFYAGHGYHDKETDLGYWLAADAKKNSRGTWLPNSQVKDYIRAIKSKHTLLITDACFSGSIFKTRRVDATSIVAKISETYRDRSRRAITSGNLSEVPDESYFIRFLIKNLEENEQVFLTSQVLYSRILEPVMNNTTTTPQQGVIQGADDEGGDFIFFKKMN